MSPTNCHKKTNRNFEFLFNYNQNITNNLIPDNNLVFESMPDLQPILDFDDGEDMDQIDGNIPSSENQSNGNGINDKKSKNSKKKDFNVTEAVLRKQAPTFLLIESLIWNLCRTKETEPNKQKQLFDSLCQRLNRLKIIGTSYKSDSLHPIREFIVDKFNELISEIQTQNKSFGPLLSSCSPMTNPVFSSAHLIHQSRYRDDFEDLGLIEAGGFGVVNRAKYRFDDCEYAVKMIRFKYTDKYDTVFKKIIREVQLYANLSSHPNVVAYKTAWLENWCLHRERLPLSKHMKTSVEQSLDRTEDVYGADPFAKDTDNDVSIRFEESSKSGIRIESSKREMSKTDEIKSQTKMDFSQGVANGEADEEEEDMSSDESSDSDSSVDTYKLQSLSDLTTIKDTVVKRKKTLSMSSTQSQSDSAVEYRNCFELQKYHKQDVPDIKVEEYQSGDCPFSCSDFGAILYIQMELCGKNLKTWLRERNDRIFAELAEKELTNKSAVDLMDRKEAKNIFRQVLKGVEYIHSQHLIHRDLKPQNILFSIDGSRVKIGDFGLATLHNSIDSEVISINLYKQSTSAPSKSTGDAKIDLNHTGNIGTSIYASPEQKSRKDYDNKTDLFSLGLILFELFYPITTEMEKVKCVSNITKKQVLPKALVKSSPNVAKIILNLTNPNPVLRSTATEILQSSLFLSEEQLIIKQLENQNKQIADELVVKDNRIEDLENSLDIERKLCVEKDKEIEVLRKQLEVMTERIKFFS